MSDMAREENMKQPLTGLRESSPQSLEQHRKTTQEKKDTKRRNRQYSVFLNGLLQQPDADYNIKRTGDEGQIELEFTGGQPIQHGDYLVVQFPPKPHRAPNSLQTDYRTRTTYVFSRPEDEAEEN